MDFRVYIIIEAPILDKKYELFVPSDRRIHDLISILNVADNSDIDLLKSFSSKVNDFEDSLIDELAIRNHIDYIITRNTKDFKNSRVLALSPEEFLDMLKLPELDAELEHN